jgi:hypothetical protein
MLRSVFTSSLPRAGTTAGDAVRRRGGESGDAETTRSVWANSQGGGQRAVGDRGERVKENSGGSFV